VYKGYSITAIIPCLNEEKAIAHVLREIPDFVDEVLVVDNNSTDRTAEVAREFRAKVVHEPVAGYGRAYKRGFACATGDIIVALDGDHQYPVSGISYLLEAFLHLEVDFLNASRFPVRERKGMSFKNKIGNVILSFALSLLFFKWVRDSQSGMWVFRRSLLGKMQLESDGMAFSEEIKIEALRQPGVRFGEISILYNTRLGESKLNPYRDGLYNLWFLVRKRFGGRRP
jgi:glycosyltransferase involved in cell wall biosynthesis